MRVSLESLDAAIRNSISGRISQSKASLVFEDSSNLLAALEREIESSAKSVEIISLDGGRICANYNDKKWSVKKVGNGEKRWVFVDRQTGVIAREQPYNIRQTIDFHQAYKRFREEKNIFFVVPIDIARTLDKKNIWTTLGNIIGKKYLNAIASASLLYSKKNAMTNLHFDAAYTRLMIQIAGKKRFILFNPRDVVYLYPFPRGSVYERRSALLEDIEDSGYTEGFPFYKKARPKVCEIDEGQWLMFPEGWWHFVKSVADENVSLLINFYDTRLEDMFQAQ